MNSKRKARTSLHGNTSQEIASTPKSEPVKQNLLTSCRRLGLNRKRNKSLGVSPIPSESNVTKNVFAEEDAKKLNEERTASNIKPSTVALEVKSCFISSDLSNKLSNINNEEIVDKSKITIRKKKVISSRKRKIEDETTNNELSDDSSRTDSLAFNAKKSKQTSNSVESKIESEIISITTIPVSINLTRCDLNALKIKLKTPEKIAIHTPISEDVQENKENLPSIKNKKIEENNPEIENAPPPNPVPVVVLEKTIEIISNKSPVLKLTDNVPAENNCLEDNSDGSDFYPDVTRKKKKKVLTNKQKNTPKPSSSQQKDTIATNKRISANNTPCYDDENEASKKQLESDPQKRTNTEQEKDKSESLENENIGENNFLEDNSDVSDFYPDLTRKKKKKVLTNKQRNTSKPGSSQQKDTIATNKRISANNTPCYDDENETSKKQLESDSQKSTNTEQEKDKSESLENENIGENNFLKDNSDVSDFYPDLTRKKKKKVLTNKHRNTTKPGSSQQKDILTTNKRISANNTPSYDDENETSKKQLESDSQRSTNTEQEKDKSESLENENIGENNFLEDNSDVSDFYPDLPRKKKKKVLTNKQRNTPKPGSSQQKDILITNKRISANNTPCYSDSDDDFVATPVRRDRKSSMKSENNSQSSVKEESTKSPRKKLKMKKPVEDELNKTGHIRINENKSYTIIHRENCVSYVKSFDNDVNFKVTESDDNQQLPVRNSVELPVKSMIIERKDYIPKRRDSESENAQLFTEMPSIFTDLMNNLEEFQNSSENVINFPNTDKDTLKIRDKKCVTETFRSKNYNKTSEKQCETISKTNTNSEEININTDKEAPKIQCIMKTSKQNDAKTSEKQLETEPEQTSINTGQDENKSEVTKGKDNKNETDKNALKSPEKLCIKTSSIQNDTKSPEKQLQSDLQTSASSVLEENKIAVPQDEPCNNETVKASNVQEKISVIETSRLQNDSKTSKKQLVSDPETNTSTEQEKNKSEQEKNKSKQEKHKSESSENEDIGEESDSDNNNAETSESDSRNSDTSKSPLLGHELEQNNIKQLVKEMATLQANIKKKQERLESLQRISVYKETHNLEELREVTSKIKRGCQEALVDLVVDLKEQSNTEFTMTTLLEFMKIPNELVGYNEEEDAFT